MSASFYDLLKYAKTGLASPGMTAYDKMRALAMAGGGAIKTLTGVPPLSFKANGEPLISWSMLGNGQQSGTPSPDNIITPEMCGVRTGNLFDITAFLQGVVPNRCTTSYDSTTNTLIIDSNGVDAHTGNNNKYHIPVTGGETYTLIWTTNPQSGDVYIFENGLTDSSHLHYWNASVLRGTVTMRNDTTFIIVRVGCSYANVTKTYTNIRLNVGSTALPYEPYGYKIPITCAGQTTPVYLGQVSTVRRVRKLVLTGNEAWWTSGTYIGAVYAYHYQFPGIKPLTPIYCTHLVDASGSSYVQGTCKNDSNSIGMWMFDTTTSPTAFKSYLSEQYAAGTPVTVWYVLAEPETGIVNEPLCKIGNYADELHSTDAGVTIPTTKGQNTLTVDTNLQPSEMTITYRG